MVCNLENLTLNLHSAYKMIIKQKWSFFQLPVKDNNFQKRCGQGNQIKEDQSRAKSQISKPHKLDTQYSFTHPFNHLIDRY